MAPPQFLLPGQRRRGSSRSALATALAAFTFFSLCLFAVRLRALQRLTSARPFGGVAGDAPRMTFLVESEVTLEPPTKPEVLEIQVETPVPFEPAPPAPHLQTHQGPSEIEVILALIAEQIANQGRDHKMEYGTNSHPKFKDDPPLLVADLPRKHIPSYTAPTTTEESELVEGESTASGKRLIIVGDVHGHLNTLKTLLRKIGFNNKHGDHLIFAGDMVTKGPDSKGVIQLAMELGASAVRGNHEDKVLAAARELRRLSVDDQSRIGPRPDGQGDEAAELANGSRAVEGDGGNDQEVDANDRKTGNARRIALSLTRAQLAWIRSLPIILRIGHIPGAVAAPWSTSTLTVAHGGLVPGIKLEKQDPWAVMNMRTLVYPGKRKQKKKGDKHRSQRESTSSPDEATPSDPSNTTVNYNTVPVPIDGRDGEPWSYAWNRHQNRLPASEPHTVVLYGHDAKAGLQLNHQVHIVPAPHEAEDGSRKSQKKETGLRYAFGLDSGCGHGLKRMCTLPFFNLAPSRYKRRGKNTCPQTANIIPTIVTALILEAGPKGVTNRIEQVTCGGAGGKSEEEEEEDLQRLETMLQESL